jgi:hypothetical protein
MATRVLLHVGTPKTGTSASQHLLFTHRDELRAHGILYPADRFDAHFLAALDLMQLHWGGLERAAAGTWDRLAAEVRAWPGTVILSHEILGRASRLQVARARESLGDAELHVVLTARDLVRQVPAEWQEDVKHRRRIGYADFLAAIRDEDRSAEIAQWFWGVQEVPAVLDRWGDGLPPAHVHVVTVPPEGAPREVLWQRFADTLGVDPGWFTAADDEADIRANASLGVAESALVRRLNERVDLVLPNHHYREFVREGLVHRNLATRRESARLTVPPDVHAWARELSRAWVGTLADRGYDVVGDLADLLPPEQPAPFVDPDTADEAEIAAAGVRALAASVQESARLREETGDLRRRVAELERELDAAHSTRVYAAKERLVGLAETNPLARVGLTGYRWLRGSSSRST